MSAYYAQVCVSISMSIQYAMKTTEEPTPFRSESLLQIEYVLKYLYQNALELTGIVYTLYNSKEDRFLEETQCPSRYG